MKKAMIGLVFLLFLGIVVVAYAQGPGESGGYGPGWYGMGPGMMGGYGPGGYGMGPGGGYGGYGMGPGMMGGYGPGGYGMGPGMMGGWGGYGGGYGGYQGGCPNCGYGWGGYGRGYRGYGPRPGYAQSEECQKFLDDTVKLRKDLYNKRFEYSEAVRNPKTSPKTVAKLEKEMSQLQQNISSEAPEGCGW
jgi:hypothetical protein